MTFAPPRRLTTVAGMLAAAFVVIAGLVVWRAGGRTPAVAVPAPFLPEDAARWFAPGASGYEPGREPADLSIRAFRTRTFGGLQAADDRPWAGRNRLTPTLRFMHNLDRVFPPALYDTHPEYFPLEAGRRIRTPSGATWWNPDLGRADVAAHAAEAARRYFSEQPASESFSLGTNDGLLYGESAETLALMTPLRWFRGRPDFSNLVFTFMNRAAEDLAKTHPDKYLGALAYYWAENTPDFAVHPQVIPFLTADRSQGYDPAFRAEEIALQARWAARLQREHPTLNAQPPISKDGISESANKRTANSDLVSPSSEIPSPISELPTSKYRLGLYDYIHSPGFLIPRQHPRLIAESLREARRLGFTDYYAEVYPNWGLDGPQPWLVAQLLQDPEQSERRLLAEYYRRYFQEAASPMQRFFRRCEEQWMNQPGPSYWLKHFRNESQATIFPSAECAELRGVLDEARRQAKSDLVRTRVRQVSDAFGVTERFVAMQEAREGLNRLALSIQAGGPGRTPNVQRSTSTAEVMNAEDGERRAEDGGRRTEDGGTLNIQRSTSNAEVMNAEDGGEAVDRMEGALAKFIAAREEFVRYTQALQAEQPLLIAPFILDDYLRHDPTANAMAWMMGEADGGQRTEDSGLMSGWQQMHSVDISGEELVINGRLAGPVRPARRVAGLDYGVALPAPWQSRVEPSQHHHAGMVEALPGVLRIAGSKDTQVFQWVELRNHGFARAQVEIRGRVPVSGVAMLTLGWLDDQHRHLGMTVMRLPEGEWPEWVTLVQAGAAPAGAAWVGVGVRIQHQFEDDWVELRNFSLKAEGGRVRVPINTGLRESAGGLASPACKSSSSK